MRRDCADWQGILAMEAIGQAGADESRELEEHLEHCSKCRQDAVDVRGAANALGYLDPIQAERLGAQPSRLDTPVSFEDERGQTDPALIPGPFSAIGSGLEDVGGRRRRTAGIGVGALAAAAAAVVAVLALGATPAPASKTVALTGAKGVQASVSLTAQSSGTRATLHESGQAAGQVLTVSMRTSSGRWWVAGSYRTVARTGPLEVQMTCAVQSNQITEVWVSDQSGHTVLDGYVH